MNKFVLSALAITTASSLALAGSETEEWLTLDNDLDALAPSLVENHEGVHVNGFLKSSYANSSDITVGGNDLGGFSIDNARVNVSGAVGDFSVFMSLEGAGVPNPGQFGVTSAAGTVGMLDAYAAWNITDTISAQAGQFRPPFLGSSLRDENQLVLLERTLQGDVFSFRDQGLQVNGAFDQLAWWVAVQNGVDGAGDDLVTVARVAFNAMGPGTSSDEGGFGAPEENCLSVAAGYYDDANITDGDVFAFDATFTRGALGATAEFVSYNDGIGFGLPVGGGGAGDSTWNITAWYMFVPDEWEGVIRFEDHGDSNDTTTLTAGVNKYNGSPNSKFQINYSTSSSDAGGNEADVIQAGMLVSI